VRKRKEGGKTREKGNRDLTRERKGGNPKRGETTKALKVGKEIKIGV